MTNMTNYDFARTSINRPACCCCPPEFCSIYEAKQALTVVQKQRLVEWFSGSCLDSRWTTTNITGSNCFQMSNSLCGGYEVVTAATSCASADTHFCNKQQYDCGSCGGHVFIAVVKVDCSATRQHLVGMNINTAYTADYVTIENSTGFTNIQALTRNGSASRTSTGIARNTNCNLWTATLTCGNWSLTHCGGCSVVCKTTCLPNAGGLSPRLRARNLSGSASHTFHWRYLEAYNT